MRRGRRWPALCERYCGDDGQLYCRERKKDYLAGQFGASACEMEGGSIGQVCYLNGVDFAIVRAISDKADGSSHMDYGAFCAMAAENSARLLCAYLQK